MGHAYFAAAIVRTRMLRIARARICLARGAAIRRVAVRRLARMTYFNIRPIHVMLAKCRRVAGSASSREGMRTVSRHHLAACVL